MSSQNTRYGPTRPAICTRVHARARASGARLPLSIWRAAPTAQKDSALRAIAKSSDDRTKSVCLEANAKDLKAAQRRGLEPALLDRLALTASGVEAMAVGCEQVAALSDPVGQISDMAYRPSGIQVGKMRVRLRCDRHHL